MKPSRRYLVSLFLIAITVGFGTAAIVLAVFSLKRATSVADLAGELYLILSNAFLLVAIVIVSIVYADSRRQKIKAAAKAEEQTSRILRRLDGIFSARTGLSTFLLQHSQNESELDACVASSAEFLNHLIDETRAMFEDHTTHACSVSIKLLALTDGQMPKIKTYARDRKSSLRRQGMYPQGEPYPISDHSPFVEIIGGSRPGDFFVSNNLRADEGEGKYKNGNPHWRKLYNSTLIVPIKEPDVVASQNILGFLCVDSMNARFDQTTSVYLAQIIANTIFYVISSLSHFEQLRSSGATKARAADA